MQQLHHAAVFRWSTKQLPKTTINIEGKERKKVARRWAFITHGKSGFLTNPRMNILTRPLGPFPQEDRGNQFEHPRKAYA